MDHPFSHGFLLILLFSSITFTIHACDLTERSALKSFASALSSLALNWTASVDCCQREGITCNQNGWIIQLRLPSKGLTGGTFPSSLGNIKLLSHLNLSHNLLSGSLEAGMFLSLSRLEILDLSYNLFSGEIPLSLSSSYIQMVDFSSNIFNGTIPSSFLQHAWNLSRSLPADIYNAQALQEISLSTNGLVGPISENVGKLSKLKLMRLHYNNLQGHLHPSLMNCTNLVEINLGFNFFSGNISVLDFSNLTQLSKLDCISNNLTGTLPISLYSCKSLKALRLATNDFEGQIQPEILQLKNLTFLSLSRNRLTSVTGAMKILTGFKSEEMPDGDITVDSGLQNLCVFSLYSCHMTGHIPAWISKLGKQEVLDLSFNRLTGTIPGWLGTLPHLFFLLLNDNLISGEFPMELCRLQALVSQKAANETGHCSLELPVYLTR
ncbi:receptor-like protein 2 [Pyrus ussuriensis x Pyrus communis]|uniref:Receptor-like protein 2 n=1 Tax=Pyrus ussuriensis x Pyrus communis TaxID=2448454 RepID=A0A5N5G194_9ROSA|nr:receptor-like protein 2 [Pyrus ussuriensis x Pyrus communis]